MKRDEGERELAKEREGSVLIRGEREEGGLMAARGGEGGGRGGRGGGGGGGGGGFGGGGGGKGGRLWEKGEKEKNCDFR